MAEKYFKGLSAQYNGAPTARISILRQRKRKGATKYRYELISQSDVIQLKPYLNSSPSFVLSKPLAVRRGDMIGLTTDSWMPAFVSGGASSTDTWRASRPTGKCNVVKNKDGTVDYTNFSTPRMHERIGQIKQYNCGYTGARVLYHATVVDTPVKTTK